MIYLGWNSGEKSSSVWVSREFSKCSGCRKCEIVCSLSHENKIWPEASRVRVFMLVPGAEFPHLCTQCEDYPCVQGCPTKALGVNKETSAVIVNVEKCVGCGKCIDACQEKSLTFTRKQKKSLFVTSAAATRNVLKSARKAAGTASKP